MCCGSKSQRGPSGRGSRTRVAARQSANLAFPTRSSPQQQPPAPAAGAAVPAASAAAPAGCVQFEYTGKTKLTVISPKTGIRYHFDSPGTRVSVDPRDQSMMVYVPDLTPVRFMHR
jgi:hypothetical protein